MFIDFNRTVSEFDKIFGFGDSKVRNRRISAKDVEYIDYVSCTIAL